MLSRKQVESQLNSFEQWIFVSEKKHYIKELASVMDGDEQVVTVLDGFFSGCEYKKETPGLFCVTDSRVVFIAEAKHRPRFEEIDPERITELRQQKSGTAVELLITAGNNTVKLKTFAKESQVRECIQGIWQLKGSAAREINVPGQRAGNDSGVGVDSSQPRGILRDVYNYLNEISLPGFLEKLTTTNREIAEKLDKEINSPGAAETLIDEIRNLNFLFAEAKRINSKITEILNSVNSDAFREKLINDIIALSSLCSIADGRLSNNELIFMSLVVMRLNPHNSLEIETRAREIFAFDSFPMHYKEDVLAYWKEVTFYIKQKQVKINGNALLSMSHLKAYDKQQGTDLFSMAGSVLYTYCQCLMKADEQLNQTEEERLKQVYTLIFNKDIEHGIAADERAAEKSDEQTEEKELTLEEVMLKIDDLVGMKNIKEQIDTFINLIKVQKEREERNLPLTPLSLHAVFYGPPGTGKTTIARLLGKVYKCLGLLAKGHLIETDRAGIVAGYVGQTAIRVDEIVKQALDGVLFIDEAYTLSPADSMGKDFGQEAIDAILKRMEDYRDRLVVIVAGYPDEMKRFINSNPGLQSRFSRYFYFDHYKPGELIQIFDIFSSNVEFIVTEKARKKLLELFELCYTGRTKSFGNGRLVRNIFEKVIEKQANRIASVSPLTDEVLCTITEEDVPEKEEV